MRGPSSRNVADTLDLLPTSPPTRAPAHAPKARHRASRSARSNPSSASPPPPPSSSIPPIADLPPRSRPIAAAAAAAAPLSGAAAVSGGARRPPGPSPASPAGSVVDLAPCAGPARQPTPLRSNSAIRIV
ncbi:hypothetical protein NL676_009155 [Syzygium grande]|nr:hypothetical protein NL676_009155 [Syzygium grande]